MLSGRPFSVAELLYAIAAGVVLLWMGAAVRRLITDRAAGAGCCIALR